VGVECGKGGGGMWKRGVASGGTGTEEASRRLQLGYS